MRCRVVFVVLDVFPFVAGSRLLNAVGRVNSSGCFGCSGFLTRLVPYGHFFLKEGLSCGLHEVIDFCNVT